MSPRDIIWRALERLRESRELFADSIAELNPREHRDLIDGLRECERLLQTQIHILRRLERRYEES